MKDQKVFDIYARKSMDKEDKQVLSIDSQIDELKLLASKLNIKIGEIFIESKSAKAPGRPIFAQLMERLYNNFSQGVLCWKLDRLARNGVDGGSVAWTIKDKGIEVITPTQTYSRDKENAILMYLEFGMAQDYIDKLAKNSQRGMKKKAEMGWDPSKAPIGYLNTPKRDQGTKIILTDKQRFILVKKMFDKILKGVQPIRVWEEARNAWNLTTSRNTPISRSIFYRVITNPFYCGEYEWPRGSGNWYMGKHEHMLTREEFDLVQTILGKKGKPRKRKHNFCYTGIFRCGECGAMITATKKTKYYKKTNRTVSYIYYHCTKKNKDHKCKQLPIKKEELEMQIGELLGDLKVPQDFVDWARKWLKYLHENQYKEQNQILASKQSAYKQAVKRLEKVGYQIIDAETQEKKERYQKLETKIEKDVGKLCKELKKFGGKVINWHRKIENSIDYAIASRLKFEAGGVEERRLILNEIGSNFIIKDKKVLIRMEIPYDILKNHKNWKEKYKNSVEPEECNNIVIKYPDLVPTSPVWRPVIDAMRTSFIRHFIIPT